MSRFISLLAVLAAVPAHAEPAHHVAFEGFGTLGGNTTVNHSVGPGIGLGADLRVTIGAFVVGGVGDTNLSSAGGSERHFGLLAGAELVSWPMLGETAHFQVLGEVGTHQFVDLGDGFLQMHISDANAELSYLGLRTGVNVVSKSGVFGGLWAVARADRGSKSMDVEVSGLFSPSTEHFELGGRELTVLLAAGIQR